MSNFFKDCLFACLRFCVGAIVAGIGAIVLFQSIPPPKNPGYNCGMDYGFALMGFTFIVAIGGGLFGVGVKFGSK